MKKLMLILTLITLSPNLSAMHMNMTHRTGMAANAARRNHAPQRHQNPADAQDRKNEERCLQNICLCAAVSLCTLVFCCLDASAHDASK